MVELAIIVQLIHTQPKYIRPWLTRCVFAGIKKGKVIERFYRCMEGLDNNYSPRI